MPNAKATIDRLIQGNTAGERSFVLLDSKDMETLSYNNSQELTGIKIVNIKKENVLSEQDVFNCFSQVMETEFGEHWDGLFHMLRNYDEEGVKFVIINLVSIPTLSDDEESNENLVSTFLKLLLDTKEERDDDESVLFIVTAPKEEEDTVRELCQGFEANIHDPMPLQ